MDYYEPLLTEDTSNSTDPDTFLGLSSMLSEIDIQRSVLKNFQKLYEWFCEILLLH